LSRAPDAADAALAQLRAVTVAIGRAPGVELG
jgi:hypothetical protein